MQTVPRQLRVVQRWQWHVRLLFAWLLQAQLHDLLSVYWQLFRVFQRPNLQLLQFWLLLQRYLQPVPTLSANMPHLHLVDLLQDVQPGLYHGLPRLLLSSVP